MEKEIIKELLKCPLSEGELKQLAEQMAQDLAQISQAEADLKSIRKRIEADISKCQSDLVSVVERYRSGFEMRLIECQIQKDFQTNTVRVVRLDTGEMIRERALTAEERQLMLDLEKKEETPAAEEKPEEDLPDADAGHPFYNDEKKGVETPP